MKKKILYVLCEGQTEEGFVNAVLRPYLLSNGFDAVKGILVSTNKEQHARGGISSYHHVKTDIELLLKSHPDNMFESYLFTTMFDFYALPGSFPGFDDAIRKANPYDRVETLEQHMATSVKDERFIPYIQLHEFESLIFCGIEYLAKLYPNREKDCKRLTLDLGKVGNPELINNGPSTAPSKRIIRAIEGGKRQKYRYNKPYAAKIVTGRVGIENLCSQCQHFGEWIEKIISKRNISI